MKEISKIIYFVVTMAISQDESNMKRDTRRRLFKSFIACSQADAKCSTTL